MRRVRVVKTVYTPSREVEWLGAWVAAAFAAALALPGQTFTLSHSFDRMAAVMPEGAWAVAIAAIAAVRMTALLVNGHWQRTPLLRAVTAALGAGLWTYVALLFVQPTWPQSTGVGAYFVIAVFEFRSTMRAGKDAAIAARVRAMMDASPAAEMPWEVSP